jgi:hypothetical protein
LWRYCSGIVVWGPVYTYLWDIFCGDAFLGSDERGELDRVAMILQETFPGAPQKTIKVIKWGKTNFK